MIEVLVIAAAAIVGMVITCCGAFYLVWRIVERKDRQLDAFADRVQAPAAAAVAAHRQHAAPGRATESLDEDDFPVLSATDPDLILSKIMEQS